MNFRTLSNRELYLLAKFAKDTETRQGAIDEILRRWEVLWSQG